MIGIQLPMSRFRRNTPPAEYVSEDPLVVRLLFEPSGRPESSNSYYTLNKLNICVVCGVQDSHIRKHIVPKEYRKYFPIVMKEHKSHDVLLVCISCHRRSGMHDGAVRQRYATLCDAPIASGDGKYTMDRQLDNVRSCARALLRSRDRMPAARVEELESKVKLYLGVDHLTQEQLTKLSDSKIMLENESYVPHGLKVVRHVMEHGGLIQFERAWREHFLQTMRPQYLPKMWTVDHNHERAREIDQRLQTDPRLREEILASADG